MELCQFPPSRDLVQLVFTSSLHCPGLQSLLLTAWTATVLERLQGTVVLEAVRAVDFHRNIVLEGKTDSPRKEELSMSALKLLQTRCRTAKEPSEPGACVRAGACKIPAVQRTTEPLWFSFALHLPPAQCQSCILKSSRRPLLKAFNSRQHTSLATVLGILGED